MSELHIVSVSGGKDSQATATIALETVPLPSIRLVFADTGNEHDITYRHLDYLEGLWGMPIARLRADFSSEIARKREFVRTKWPEQGVPADVVERALAALVATGIPFLDLCIWKGRFPSRKAQFCTQFLKRHLIDPFIIDHAVSSGVALGDVHSWQGVRRDESAARKDALDHELTAEGWWIERPIAGWTARQVVDFCRSRGQELNPLYRMGMGRVGCMPCINCGKNELSEIDRRFPEVAVRIGDWEQAVSAASKWSASSFFAAPDKNGRGAREGRNITERLDWAQTTFGGRQYDLLKAGPAATCSSNYGLCE